MSADYVVDIGPGAGELCGGKVIAEGNTTGNNGKSRFNNREDTSQGPKTIHIPKHRNSPNGNLPNSTGVQDKIISRI